MKKWETVSFKPQLHKSVSERPMLKLSALRIDPWLKVFGDIPSWKFLVISLVESFWWYPWLNIWSFPQSSWITFHQCWSPLCLVQSSWRERGWDSTFLLQSAPRSPPKHWHCQLLHHNRNHIQCLHLLIIGDVQVEVLQDTCTMYLEGRSKQWGLVQGG